MLFGYHKQDDANFDKDYVIARRKVDLLCGMIISGRLERAKALDIYAEIEREYIATGPERPELFKMIYENRILRLCDQFCMADTDEK
jgi:hypothetical protein